jgi:hypothetical protein
MKTIRHACGIAFFLACFFSLLAQEKGTSGEENNPYRMALSATVKEMAKSYGNIDDSDLNTRIRTDYRHVIVEKTDEITDGLPTRIGEHEIEYLDYQGLDNRYQTLKKAFAVLRIHPISIKDGRLKVYIGVSWFSSSKHNRVFAFSDWSDVEIRYDCETQKWIVADVKLGGI